MPQSSQQKAIQIKIRSITGKEKIIKQPKRVKAIQASVKRRFKVGELVSWITSREGSVKDDFVATGKVTEIRNLKPDNSRSSLGFLQSNQIVTAKINNRGREITGKLGVEAPSNHFIKASKKTEGKSFITIGNRFLIDADDLKKRKS